MLACGRPLGLSSWDHFGAMLGNIGMMLACFHYKLAVKKPCYPTCCLRWQQTAPKRSNLAVHHHSTSQGGAGAPRVGAPRGAERGHLEWVLPGERSRGTPSGCSKGAEWGHPERGCSQGRSGGTPRGCSQGAEQ
eukprot:3879158-Karenia_brevis.AAC.1